jgi:hypothetical protein
MATIHLTTDLKIESIPRRERWDPRPLVAISLEARLPFPTVAPDEDLVKRLPANNQVLALPCSNGETSWRQREWRRTGRSGSQENYRYIRRRKKTNSFNGPH